MSSNWCTIESDPGVFTELISSFGVTGVQVEELCTLEEDELARLAPIYGLIFLFKWRKETDERPTIDASSDEPGLFFAHQVINNACATQAILSVLLNQGDLELGATLSEFKAFTAEFGPDLKGLAISNSETIRSTHNSFGRQEPFMVEETKATEKDDVFHFIAYQPFNSSVYELDGLKPGPIALGDAGGDWLQVARQAIQTRIERYAASEIKFSLLAICKSRKQAALEAIAAEEARIARISATLEGTATPMDTGAGADTPDALAAQRIHAESTIEELRAEVIQEEQKLEAWHQENIRRKHNYIPFVVEMLKVLAEKKKLTGLVDKAEAKKKEIMAKKAAA